MRARMAVRIRLRFHSTPLHYAKKCCFLFDRDACRTVADLAYLITARFGVEASGVQLFFEDFLLPPNESASIVRDNDLIEVRSVEGEGLVNDSKRVNGDSPPTSVAKKARKQQKQQTHEKPVTTTCSKTAAPSAKPVLTVNPSATRQTEKKPSVLRAVKKVSDTGGTHLTFHSSSSSSSSNSDSSESSSGSSDDDESESIQNKVPGSVEKTTPKTLQKSATVSSQSAKEMVGGSGTKVRGGRTSVLGKGRGFPSSQTPQNGPRSGVAARQVGGASSRRGRGRGRGRGRVVGGEHDVLKVKSVTYTNTGESNRERERKGERDQKTVTNGENKSDKSSSTIKNMGSSGDSIWERSKAGFTEESTVAKLTTNPAVEREGTEREAERGGTEREEVEKMAAETGEVGEMGNGDKLVVSEPVKVVARDYPSLPALLGAPRAGDHIAFKVLELSSDCTPEISEYKEAEVVAYDSTSSSVTVKYLTAQSREENTPEGSHKSALLRHAMTEEEDKSENGSHDAHVTFNLGSLLQPKLINQ